MSDGPFDAEQNANIPTVSYEVSRSGMHAFTACISSDLQNTVVAQGLMLSTQVEQPLSFAPEGMGQMLMHR